jgi:hypothetical protein
MAQTRGGPEIGFTIQQYSILCAKKGGSGYRIVQDFRELNQKYLMDKYTMKDIHKCIGDIG